MLKAIYELLNKKEIQEIDYSENVCEVDNSKFKTIDIQSMHDYNTSSNNEERLEIMDESSNDSQSNEETVYVVEDILGHRLGTTSIISKEFEYTQVEFLVKWKGYDSSEHNTNEPWIAICHTTKLRNYLLRNYDNMPTQIKKHIAYFYGGDINNYLDYFERKKIINNIKRFKF